MIIIAEKLNGTIPSMAKAIAGRDEEWLMISPGKRRRRSGFYRGVRFR